MRRAVTHVWPQLLGHSITCSLIDAEQESASAGRGWGFAAAGSCSNSWQLVAIQQIQLDCFALALLDLFRLLEGQLRETLPKHLARGLTGKLGISSWISSRRCSNCSAVKQLQTVAAL